MNPSSRKDLRAQLRAARRAVDPEQRERASRLVARHADHAFHLRPGQRIALYSALPEELDTAPLIELARARGCRIYFPRINRRTRGLRFVEAAGASRVNALGIAEPRGWRFIGAQWLDVVFLPLVGFDAKGTRLGMGGGYYDRAFAFRHRRHLWRGPRLIGLAYAFQQCTDIIAASHDVQLDAVVTEKSVMYSSRG